MTATVDELARVQRRSVRTLVVSQAVGGVGVAAGIAVGGLLAEEVSGQVSLAGLAQSAAVLGAALLAVPLARLAVRSGRRPALVTGYAAGAVGSAGAVLAAVLDSFWLLVLALALFGGATAANLQARYAATDAALPAHRGRALSVVVWATTLGAVAGPNLSGAGGDLALALGLPPLAGPFLISVVAFALAQVVVWGLLRPDPLVAAGGTRTAAEHRHSSVREAVRLTADLPPALAGLVGIAAAHAVMVLVMVMTPVHLVHGGATLTVVGVVISAHIAGMYVASPVFGVLADRVGAGAVLAVGLGLLGASLVLVGAVPSSSHGLVGVALALLGLGWSAGLVGGSTLISVTVPVAERASVQGASDLLMGVAAAGAGAVAGPLLAVGGMLALAVAAAVLLLPPAVLLLRLRGARGNPVDPVGAAG